MRHLLIFATLALCLLGGQASFGQSYVSRDSVLIKPKLYLAAGIFFPDISSRLRVDSDIGLGTEIDLEDDLKLDESLSVFRIGATVQPFRKSQFVFAYTSINRGRSLELDEHINFLDTTFYIGAELDVTFNMSYYALTWRYMFFEETNWNAGLSLGLRAARFNASLDAALNSLNYSASATAWAPVLLFGVHGAGYLTPRLLARYSLEYLYLNIAEIDITVVENNASVEYFITKNLGLGIAYSTNGYRLKEIPFKYNNKGKVIYAFGGFNLFLTSRF